MTDQELKEEMASDMAMEERIEANLRTDWNMMMEHIEDDMMMVKGYIAACISRCEVYGWEIDRKKLLEDFDICV